MVFLPHKNTVIILEPFCGTNTELGLSVAMLELIRMSSNMADRNQQKHLLPSFATKA